MDGKTRLATSIARDSIAGSPYSICFQQNKRLNIERLSSMALLLRFAVISFYFLLIVPTICSGSSACKFGKKSKYDLSPLQGFIWNSTVVNESEAFEFRFSLCEALQEPVICRNSSVCRVKLSDGSATAVGNFSSVVKNDEVVDGFWATFIGDPNCPDGGFHKTLVLFECGENLGLPKLLNWDGCFTSFLWKTSVACPKTKPKKEVPCYQFDSHGNLYDLTPLIKSTGSYSIKPTSAPVVFYINICSEPAPDGTSASSRACSAGSGACRVIGSQVINFGAVETPLMLTSGGDLQIVYRNDDGPIPSGCDQTPRTTVTFVCPIVGGGKNPIIVSSSNCDLKVEWMTEYACPSVKIQSTDGCKLYNEVHGLNVDLLAMKAVGVPFSAKGNVSDKSFDFYLSACGGLPKSFSCSNVTGYDVTACQKANANDTGIIIGQKNRSILSYSNGELVIVSRSDDTQSCPESVNATAITTVIHLICSPLAVNWGVGVPVFLRKEECTYFFEWHSKAACVEMFLGSRCNVLNDTKLIDLTSLKRGPGEVAWEVESARNFETTRSNISRIFLNVCGAVGQTVDAKDCPIGAAVCVQSNNNTTENFGQFARLPQIDPISGNVQITYTNGEPCPSNSSLNRTTTVTFKCWPGMKNRSPREVHMSPDGCYLEIEWITTAACVQEFLQGDNCKVEDTQLGFSFDLTPLKRDFYYLVSAGDYDYFLNLCAPLKGSDVPCVTRNSSVSVCQVLKSDRTKFWSLGRSSQVVSYFGGVLNVTYTGGSPHPNTPLALRKSEIIFECDHSAGIGEPVFVKEAANAYSFLWRTSHVCPFRPVQCVVKDSAGIQYDLSSLSRGYEEQNWIVDGNTEADLGYDRYYINVCSVIGNSAPSGCDPNAGACATRVSNNSEVVRTANMGVPIVPPYVENGKVALKLVNGSQCPQNPSKNYTTFIYFMCANEHDGQESSIVLLRNLPSSCIAMFLWITKAACHISQLAVANVDKDQCVVYSPYAEFTFDLSSLNVSLHTSSSSGDFVDFYVNVCGSVPSSSCNLPTDAISNVASACGYSPVTDDGLVLGLAETRTLEALTEDVISVKYNTSYLKTGYSGYEIEVLLKCRRDVDKNSLRFIRKEIQAFIFELETPVVCPPQPVDCFVRDMDNNVQYDLNPLIREMSNWIVFGMSNTQYIINVCKSVNGQGLRTTCDGTDVGACMVDQVSGKSVIMGHVQSRPQVTGDGSVTLRYLHGAPCTSGDFFYSMRINFLCSKTEGQPEFIGETPECEIIVDWKTTAACPLQRAIQDVGSDCKVYVPEYGTTVDFSKLKKAEGYSVAADGRQFRLNICGPLKNGCQGLNNSGVCVTSGNLEKSAGNYSDKPSFNDGVFMLEYHAGSDRGSWIMLSCDHRTNGSEGPTYLESFEDGPFMFFWLTSYACLDHHAIDCRIGGPDGKLYDLSGLTLSSRNHIYVTEDKKRKYWINVCQPVVITEDMHCPFGVGICAVNTSDIALEHKYMNLGEVHQGPEVENGILKLKYTVGEPCKRRDGSWSFASTTIRFYCHTQNDEPRLISENDCEYSFDWFTSAACPINIPDYVGADCSVSDPLTGFRFNLSSLRNMTEPYRVHVNGDEFLLNVCEPVKPELCGSTSALAGSCHISHGGEAKQYLNVGVANSQLHRRGDIMFLNYSNGKDCHDGALAQNTLITFMCGEEGSGKGHPYFAGSTDNCTYFFNWKTELACERKLNCLVEYGGEVFDLKQLSQNSEQPVAISKLDNGNIYLINVCRPLITGPRVNCPPGAAVCQLQLGNHIGLNLGHAVKEPSADNQGHVTIEYTHGSPCPGNPGVNMSSKIVFICQEGSDKGVPELMEVTDDCVYMFQWRTYVICPKAQVAESRNCSFFDSRTRFTFDLSPLSVHATTVTFSDGNFILNPCGSVNDSNAVWSPAGPSGRSWGSAIGSRFWYDGSALRVAYNDGDICPSGGRKSSAIWFICEPGIGVGQPELTTVSDCEASFNWRTEHACQASSSSCVAFLADSYSLVDLRYLSAANRSWVARDSDGNAYLLNICNGILPSEASESCSTSASVCMKSALDGKIYELGNIATQRITTEGDAVTIRYTSLSDVCAPKMFTQVLISFFCGPQLGVPRLVSKTNTTGMCNFYFMWKTRVACGSKSFRQVYSSDGLIEDPEFGWTANLTSIFNKTVHTVEKRETALLTYLINMNGLRFVTGNPCNGSAVCFNSSADPTDFKCIGVASSRKLYVQNNELIADFTTSETCAKNPNKNVSSSVSFGCDHQAGHGNPQFIYESQDCHYTFIWETDLMCSTLRRFANETNQVADSTNFPVGVIIGVVIVAIIACAITVILLRKNTRIRVQNRVQSLFQHQPSSSSDLRYSVLLNNSEETALLRSGEHRDIVMQRLPANGTDLAIA